MTRKLTTEPRDRETLRDVLDWDGSCCVTPTCVLAARLDVATGVASGRMSRLERRGLARSITDSMSRTTFWSLTREGLVIARADGVHA
jgi:Mn-dependent DtxR family transcriptional regulator